MQKTVVLNVVGLTPALLGEHTPNLSRWANSRQIFPIIPAFPAVTCTAQATYLTGKLPREHGIVGNGWYFRDTCEVRFWRQSNKLVRGDKIWDRARSLDPNFTCANLFWWYNMYSSADWEVTPRPMYPADGRKLPDINTQPPQLREQLQAELGQFPLFQFWGPGTSIAASQWIARAAQWLERKASPTLTLVYLPHLDYCLQKFGSENTEAIAADLQAIDRVCGELIDVYQARNARILVLSEYGIAPVSQPVHLNRILREAGWIALREELGRELLDAGASRAFAVADHQVAHIYVRDKDDVSRVCTLLAGVEGVETVLDGEGQQKMGLDDERSGDLVAIAAPNAWFTYYYWLDDSKAPDFARTVDIHRKPGYDPVELFLDPQLKFPQLKIAWTLLKKQLGFRTLMDVIPLDATLVKGSHGRLSACREEGPLLIGANLPFPENKAIAATQIYDCILHSLLDG
ncbi:MAG: alkaline phosphatase family protein [Spirulina sp.]